MRKISDTAHKKAKWKLQKATKIFNAFRGEMYYHFCINKINQYPAKRKTKFFWVDFLKIYLFDKSIYPMTSQVHQPSKLSNLSNYSIANQILC